MQIKLMCSHCLRHKYDDPNEFDDWTAEIEKRQQQYNMPLQSERLYVFQCVYGHTSKVIMGHHMYAMLYEAGINAVRDGYYREALLSFHAAIESFYELGIYSILIGTGALKTSEGAECSTKQYQVDVAWNRISSQVERQMGAFIMLYYSWLKEAPTEFSDNLLTTEEKKIIGKKGLTNMRNKATHGGYIPSRSQAIVYGEAVQKLIIDNLRNINKANDTVIGRADMVLRRETGDHKVSDDDVVYLTAQNVFLNRYFKEGAVSLYEVLPLYSDWPKL